MAIRSESTIKTTLDSTTRKPGASGFNYKKDASDRAELAVVYRIQQRLHFSRQNASFGNTGELTYY